ncbi:hypothetical protein AB0I10_08715 [Streptomyces sp. NPDC050636]|uniref:hypothetical protein n=1 Tax=Streptomyces sp. NPDC050636 TaxID=3154510 RepID=UPI00344A1069
MTRNPRAITACLALGGVGLAATLVRVLMQPSLPLPRWDLLACLALAVAGVAAALVLVRMGRDPEPGGIGTRKYWWPDQRTAWLRAGCAAVFVPAFLVAYAAMSYSPEAWAIDRAGGRIGTVEVQKVLSSEYHRTKNSGHYSMEIEVSVPFDKGAVTAWGQFDSKTPVERGDQVWALYAPSSAELGAYVDGDPDDLRQRIGGAAPTGLWIIMLGWIALWVFMAKIGGASAGAASGIRPAMRTGKARWLPVTVLGAGVALGPTPAKGEANRSNPRVQVEGSRGQRLDLFTDRVVDPVELDRSLAGRPATLYWARDDRTSRAHKFVQGVLVVDGERYVRGWAEGADGSRLPSGKSVSAGTELPEGGELRAVWTRPRWQADLQARGMLWLLIGLLALLAITLGVGDAATLMLAGLAAFAPLVARVVVSHHRGRNLRSLLR